MKTFILPVGLYILSAMLSLDASGQIKIDPEKIYETAQEPYHHVILENEYVTVMRVMIPPRVSTGFHEQHLDYVNTHIQGSKVLISYKNKPDLSYEMKSGNVKFGQHQGKSTIDKVKNVDTKTNHQVAFEIQKKGPLGFGGAERPKVDFVEEVLNEKSVKGWKFTLQAGESAGTYVQKGPGVRVFFTAGRVLLEDKANHFKEIYVHPGDAFLTKPGKVLLFNGGDEPLLFNDYELL